MLCCSSATLLEGRGIPPISLGIHVEKSVTAPRGYRTVVVFTAVVLAVISSRRCCRHLILSAVWCRGSSLGNCSCVK